MLKRHGLKKGLSLVLVFCLILSLMPTVALAQEPTASTGTETTVGVTGDETTTPPTEGETTPPTEGETTPPTEGETTPPTEGETTPPTEGETTPPTEGETTPPTEGETTPPTGGETTPPTEGETTPPAGGETTPPAEGETTPPAEGDPGMTDEPGTVEEPPITDQDIPHMQTKPADGESAYTPFDAWVGESDHFRIPALVTTESGRLIAAADARWDGTGDGYGLDTIVAYSTPTYSGDVWKYTYANYLGDNGNKINSSSTAFIDPALAADGNTIYMLVDLFPGGVMISNAQKGTGFDAQGRLLLKKSGESAYDYYVGEFVDGYASIFTADNTMVDGYEVDEYYNLYSKDGVSNVFFADAAFQVFPTSYLYLTTSTDGGKEWSAPQLLNADVKRDDEAFYGVGPGRGLVTSDGTIMFPCYVYDGQYGQRSSFIYLDKDSGTWQRTPDIDATWTNWWSSESQLVELSDHTIRSFFRNGTGKICYADYNRSTGSWSASVSTGISVESNCQISAITYSETINGQQAILLSCPSDFGRANGKIYVMLVGEGNALTELTAFSVNSGYFGYSCLTELKDGRIAILYEGDENFASMDFARYAIEDVVGVDAQIGDNVKVTDKQSGVSVVAPNLESITIEKDQTVDKLEGTDRPYVAYDFTLTTEGGMAYTDAARVYIPAEELPGNLENPVGFVVDNEDGSIKEISGYFTEDGAYFVFEMPHFSVGGVAGDPVETSLDYKNQETIKLVENGTWEQTFAGDLALVTEGLLDEEIATVSKDTNVTGSTTRYWVEKITSPQSGTAYVIEKDGKYLTEGLGLTTKPEEAAQWTWDGSKLHSGSNYLRYKNRLTTTTGSDHATIWNVSDGVFTYTYNVLWWEETYTLGQAYLLKSEEIPGGPQTTIMVEARSEGETQFALGDPATGTLYTVQVEPKPDVVLGDNLLDPNNSNRAITKLTTSVGVSYQLSAPDVPYGGSVDWTSSNDSIATVSNGYITGRGVGDAEITATVKDSGGNPVAVYTIPVTVLQGSGSNRGGLVNIYISEITDTTVYYNFNCTTNMTEVRQGELLYVRYSGNMSIDFFGAPNEGYALTRMSATNSQGNYQALNSSNPTQTDFYNQEGTAGYFQRSVFGDHAVQQMIKAALNKNCDGGLGFTRQDGSDVGSDLTFRSEKLPTVSKEVVSVNGVDYTPGMIAHQGEVVRFKITVTQYACENAITYTSPVLTDLLDGAVFEGSHSSVITPTLSNGVLWQDQVKEYFVNYTIKESDLDTTIVNKAQLSYTYKSQYSSGSFGGTAEDQAEISAVTFEPKSIVVDFGLPVVMDFSGKDDHGRYNLANGWAEYGDVSVSGNVVTYTPNTVLTGVDTVTLVNEKGGRYTFDVYPATTVYYEEGFATPSGFSAGSRGTGKQTFSVTGSGFHYGYDEAYTGYVGESNRTAMTSSHAGDSAIFEFTGTGVEIYANCTPTSGTVLIQVSQGAKTIKTLLVDTAMVNGHSNATDFQAKNGYNVPIASLLNLSNSPEEYTVEITNVENKGKVGTVSLDGFRVHGTLNTNNAVYTQDGENDPAFVQLRDVVLAGVPTTGSQYAQQIAVNAMSQVYASGHDTRVVVLEQSGGGIAVSQDLLDFGPKNELYLAAGQSVTFKLNSKAQIGLRALDQQVSYKINSEEKTLNSSTDMFTKGYEGSVTITNNGDGILAITQIKAVNGIDSAEAKENTLVLQPLTADDLVPALVAMGCSLSDEDF